MTSWIRFWPLLCVPVVLLALLSGLPTVPWHAHVLGGGPVRQWVLNHGLLPLLPTPWAAQIVAWDAHWSVLPEWLLTVWVAVNLNVVLLPPLYVLGSLLITLMNWLARTDLGQKQAALRKR